MSDMTPEKARAELDSSLHTRTPEYILARAERALRTLAAMRVEHDHGVVGWEQVDGRYETRHRVRLVSEWRDEEPLI